MSRHDDKVSLRQMLDHAREALDMSRGRSRVDLDRHRQFFLSVLKLVEIVGEAARRVSEATRKAHPQVPWPKIVGTRDRLVHGYDRVDFDMLWRIVHEELPALVAELQRILGEGAKDVQ